MGRLYFLRGLPRSGKSTLAHEWLYHKVHIIDNDCVTSAPSLEPFEPRAIVCADDIRLAFGYRYNDYFEGVVKVVKHAMIVSLLRKHNVLVDGTHTTSENIRELFSIDRTALYYTMKTTAATCIERAEATNQDDLVPIIQRISQNMKQCVYLENIRQSVIHENYQPHIAKR